MEVSIHSNFMESWADLGSQDKKETMDMIKKVKKDSITPGMRPHPIDVEPTSLLSLSPNMDLRVLGWKTSNDNLILVHVDNHDNAYKWAENNNQKIAAAEALNFGSQKLLSETSTDYEEEKYGEKIYPKLQEAGVPDPLCNLLRESRSEWELTEKLELVAPEWQELILDAVTGKPDLDTPDTVSNIWISPDDESLEAALSLPLSQWRVFLHPRQREIVTADCENDIAIVGGPGTGKTVSLVHRAVELSGRCARGECVVVVGHSPSAAEDLREMVSQLAGGVPNNIEFVDMINIGRDGKSKWGDVVGPRGPSGRLQIKGNDIFALLIDEAQDIHTTTRSFIFKDRDEVSTHLTFCVDFHQGLYSDMRDSMLATALKRAEIKDLDYSYRIPKESGQYALDVKEGVDIETDAHDKIQDVMEVTSDVNFGYSKEFNELMIGESTRESINNAVSKYEELDINTDNVAAIFCGTSNQRKEYAEELSKMGYKRDEDVGLITPRSAKGKEFEYCLVVCPELLFDVHNNLYKIINSVYVSISRSRRGFTIFTNKDFAQEYLPGDMYANM